VGVQDGRKSQRERRLKRGSILPGNGGTIDCTIRNINSSGACLVVPSPFGIPDRFVLLIPIDKVKRHCRVIWRSATQLGVTYSDTGG